MSAYRVGALALIGILMGAAVPAAESSYAGTLQKIYARAVDDAYSRHAVIESDGTTFVWTGDIQFEWLRDSSAVLVAYVDLSAHDPYVKEMLRGAIARQARYVLLDAYANAFTSDYRVAERKFEMDSLVYPVWFATRYWRSTGDRSIFTSQLQSAFGRILQVLRTEQHHAKRSHYRHPDLANNGKGSAVAVDGLIWTGFRPSDDPAQFQYNIPDNMFAVVALRDLTKIERDVYHNNRLAEEAWGLSVQIATAIERQGTVFMPGFGRIYAYETDGFGHANLMDDANLPSLLSIPYFGYVNNRDSQYKATRRFVLSPHNPYFYQGKLASGIGSPHTPFGYVWPLALVVQALTSSDDAEVDRLLGYIAASDSGDHRLHESFNPSNPHKYTRADFAWPNALFAELMRSNQSRLPLASRSRATQSK